MKPMIELPVRKIVLVLAGMVAFFFLLALPAPVFRYGMGHDYVRGFVPFAEQVFDLDREGTPATWFSSVLLLLSALLLGYIGLAVRSLQRPYSRHWLVLAGIFLFLSLDEATAIHERANSLRFVFNLGGIFRFAWVIVAIPLLAVLALAYLRFLLSLPSRTRNLFILAGAIFVGGALGVEFFQAYYADTMLEAYWTSLRRVVLSHTEEVMEMTGLVLFIYALLDHVRARSGRIAISLAPGSTSSVRGEGRYEHRSHVSHDNPSSNVAERP